MTEPHSDSVDIWDEIWEQPLWRFISWQETEDLKPAKPADTALAEANQMIVELRGEIERLRARITERDQTIEDLQHVLHDERHDLLTLNREDESTLLVTGSYHRDTAVVCPPDIDHLSGDRLRPFTDEDVPTSLRGLLPGRAAHPGAQVRGTRYVPHTNAQHWSTVQPSHLLLICTHYLPEPQILSHKDDHYCFDRDWLLTLACDEVGVPVDLAPPARRAEHGGSTSQRAMSALDVDRAIARSAGLSSRFLDHWVWTLPAAGGLARPHIYSAEGPAGVWSDSAISQVYETHQLAERQVIADDDLVTVSIQLGGRTFELEVPTSDLDAVLGDLPSTVELDYRRWAAVAAADRL